MTSVLVYPLSVSVTVRSLYHSHLKWQHVNCFVLFHCTLLLKHPAREKIIIFVPTQLVKIITLHCDFQKCQAFVNCRKEGFQNCKSAILLSDTNPLWALWVFPRVCRKWGRSWKTHRLTQAVTDAPCVKIYREQKVVRVQLLQYYSKKADGCSL